MRPLLLASIVAAWSLGSVAAVPTHFLTPAQDEEFEVGEMYLLEWTPYLSRKEFTRISLSGTNSTDYSSNFADTISNSGFMNQAFGVIFLRDRHSSASQFNVTEIGKVYMGDGSYTWPVPMSMKSGEGYVITILFGSQDQTEVWSAAQSDPFIIKEKAEDGASGESSSLLNKPDEEPKAAGVSKGALIGAVVGSIIGTTILALGAFLIWRRVRKHDGNRDTESSRVEVIQYERSGSQVQVDEREIDTRVVGQWEKMELHGDEPVPSLHEVEGSSSAELYGSEVLSSGDAGGLDTVVGVSPLSPATPLEERTGKKYRPHQ